MKNLFSTQPSLHLLLLTCLSKFLFISRAGLNFLSLALFFLVLLLSNCKKIYSQEPLTPVNQAITSLDKSLNQIDIVNISSPNANGVSHNLFVDYNADKYFENITNDLKNNKKICVVSMASNFALDVYNKYCK